ncbi:cysteine hydrolase family protein [Aporhodopirellula aestuarii]|uniref:Cysteine hydrolase n=1 Tax=Aporhodopirellula aestuarii TaxID=2950107 RepID=A0ABT0U4T0_9BACT|nr:isochorismatase family cysteine hydrolase [Aporhodopirellula aestuarii]MCM2371913.1 cysteine hydrolase [Aporhodopirellula aestuarii]
MPAKRKRSENDRLQGCESVRGEVALLIIDMINDLEFDEGQNLLKHALPAAENLAKLKQHFRDHDLPIIYANDNFGKWKSDFRVQVEHCLREGVCGQPIVEMLLPHDEDYFVLKPKHSAFYATTLDVLLEHLQVKRLVITGVATDICVLFTSNDAYMRDFRIAIPADCVAANTRQRSEDAISLMKRVLKADVRNSSELMKDIK